MAGCRTCTAASRAGMTPHIARLLLIVLTLLVPQAQAGDNDAMYSEAALYNQANAYARAGRSSLAILFYQRAAMLAPHDEDVQANLARVRASSHLSTASLHGWRALALQVSAATAYWCGVAAICLIGLGACLLRVKHAWRRASGALVAIGAALLAYCMANAAAFLPLLQEAVAVSATPLRVAPVPMAEPLNDLIEGETIRLLAEHENFALVERANGVRGWVLKSSVVRVVPASS